ncbi:MAG: hypothetical protein PHC53_03745 [Patescibacteria group bacterium]|nr:hypothetical protein [Patescibacteria group bacterium]
MRFRFMLAIVEVSERECVVVHRSEVEQEFTDALDLAKALAIFARQQSGVDRRRQGSPIKSISGAGYIPLPPVESGYGQNTRVVIEGIEQLS